MSYFTDISTRWYVAKRDGKGILSLLNLIGGAQKSQQSVEDVEVSEALRLAETAPHLLRDIGFWQECDGTWTNGRTRISVPRTSAAEILLRSGRL